MRYCGYEIRTFLETLREIAKKTRRGAGYYWARHQFSFLLRVGLAFDGIMTLQDKTGALTYESFIPEALAYCFKKRRSR